jgi:hypothetical protein
MQERRHSGKPPPPEETPGGPFYGELIREALTEERARKDSLERRGATMVTASAFLSALVLSLLTFTFKNISELPGLETVAVWVALAGFVLAAALGLLVNRPVGYSEPTVDYLKRINEQTYWDSSQQTAASRVNESRLKTIASYRDVNKRKATLFMAALVCETAGIASLALLILALIY